MWQVWILTLGVTLGAKGKDWLPSPKPTEEDQPCTGSFPSVSGAW